MKKNRIYNLLLIASTPFLLVSCFAAKDYQKPEVLEETHFRTDQIAKDSTSLAQLSYQDLFTDSILQDHINTALKNNIDIRVALQQIMAAEAYLKQGKAGYLPSLNANAQWTHQELARNSQFGSFFNGALDQYELSAGLSWEADIWGKIRSQKRAFEASYLQSVAAHKAVKTRLIASVANIYYQLLALDEQIKITEQTIENRQNSLSTTNALKEAGNLTEVGVQQTEAQLYTAQAILVDLQKQVRLLENSMSILLGEAPQFIPRSALSEQQIITELKTGVPAQLLSNRPDVIAAEMAFRNAFELSNVARSNFYPSLTLTANTGFQSLDLSELLDANSLVANVVSGLAQPIFNKRQIKTQYEVTQAQQEQARLRFKEAILQASKEVSDAMYAYQAAEKKQVLKQKEFNANQKATDYSEELLNNGFANYLEVLTARENALNSQLGMIDAKYSRLKAVVDLYRALGGGWQ